MTSFDNVAATAKKNPTVVPDHGDHSHDSTATQTGDKLHDHGVLAAWTQEAWKDTKAAFHGVEKLVGGTDTDGKLTFSNPFAPQADGKAAAAPVDGKVAAAAVDGKVATTAVDGTATATDTTAGKPTAAQNDSSLSSWISNMDKSLGVSNVVADATKGFDWLFQAKEGDTSKTVSAKAGEATVKQTNGDGVTTDVHATKGFISADAGAAHVAENKTTHEIKYNSTDGQYNVDLKGDNATVKGNNGDVMKWNSKTQEGTLSAPDGKPVIHFDSQQNLTQQLTADSTLTQTNGDAAATADAAKKANGGQPPEHTQIVADNKGNYAINRKDGLEVKTNKATGEVTLEEGGQTIKVQNGKAQAQVTGDDGKQHWVPVQNDQLPNGMQIKSDGSVAVKGQTVVDASGNVHSDNNTVVNTKQGSMTTNSDTGTVTATNDGNKTTVTHAGVGTITNDGNSYVNSDQATQNVFQSWNPGAHTLDVMGGPGQSGVQIDTNPGGGINVTESNGQVTSMFSDGQIQSWDSSGTSLFNVDQQGDVCVGTGDNSTQISSDGTVSDSSGSAAAWGGDGTSASDQLTDASAATSFADDGSVVAGDPTLAASTDTTDPTSVDVATVSLDAGNLASLGGQDAQLEALMAQDTTGRGRANLLGQLQNADGKVLDAENVVQTQLAATQADLANSSPAVTKLMAAGLSREQAMSAVSSQGNAEATAA